MKPPYQRDENHQPQRYPGQRRRGKKRNLLPFLIFAIVAVMILKEQVPWLDDKIQGIIAPGEQAAIEACRQTALLESEHPEFARIIKGGETTETQNGLLVKGIVLGEMSADKGEQRVRITCHVDSHGTIANLHREPITSVPTVSPPAVVESGPRTK